MLALAVTSALALLGRLRTRLVARCRLGTFMLARMAIKARLGRPDRRCAWADCGY
jgi:hypothetical protein